MAGPIAHLPVSPGVAPLSPWSPCDPCQVILVFLVAQGTGSDKSSDHGPPGLVITNRRDSCQSREAHPGGAARLLYRVLSALSPRPGEGGRLRQADGQPWGGQGGQVPMVLARVPS